MVHQKEPPSQYGLPNSSTGIHPSFDQVRAVAMLDDLHMMVWWGGGCGGNGCWWWRRLAGLRWLLLIVGGLAVCLTATEDRQGVSGGCSNGGGAAVSVTAFFEASAVAIWAARRICFSRRAVGHWPLPTMEQIAFQTKASLRVALANITHYSHFPQPSMLGCLPLSVLCVPPSFARCHNGVFRFDLILALVCQKYPQIRSHSAWCGLTTWRGQKFKVQC
ncbi:hypothetical protein BAUCODRAFT_344531 [Baudoinia panamericana UAMH 10762]|uniref:Uncharacterized protein n=1 Tax=Baudoinia panamericana (strain UAMH 10762) TaxID=717646 RepID=M2NJQ2_BAUPA|nr:uncharacterized protein BAUCODRAFT_344531 [Baudoinia panamericana UAMH 10762]EMC99644.1 hypothetical protein BAUCODRAFT_344531 [Baudoinia panamericana UAMH 10762]